MIKILGLKLPGTNKLYYFKPCDLQLLKGDKAIVETEKGLQLATVETNIYNMDESKIMFPVKNILRIANKDDIEIFEENENQAKLALEYAQKTAKKLNLNMKIVGAVYVLDRKQLVFNFTADDRIDFRDLAKSLSKVYKTRIELRQIGTRDKARDIGGIGQCGRSLCCASFLNDLNSVSINMAKNQNLALNPQKINGSCGRLMCCLKYENILYETERKKMPKIGQKTIDGKVIELDILNQKYKVICENGSIKEVQKNEDSVE